VYRPFADDGEEDGMVAGKLQSGDGSTILRSERVGDAT
jgi:hypothetical protein